MTQDGQNDVFGEVFGGFENPGTITTDTPPAPAPAGDPAAPAGEGGQQVFANQTPPAEPPAAPNAPLDGVKPPEEDKQTAPDTPPADTPPADTPPPPSPELEQFEKIQQEAAVIGGAENIPAAIHWTSMLFGMSERPVNPATGQPYEPAQFFLDTLATSNRGVYDKLAWTVIHANKEEIMEAWMPEILDKIGIPQDKLSEAAEFVKFGAMSADPEETKDFVRNLQDSRLQNWFNKQTPTMKANLMTSMPLEIAKNFIENAIFREETQTREQQRAEQQKAFEARQAEARLASERTQLLDSQQSKFAEIKSKELGIPVQQVNDLIELTAVRMDREVTDLENKLKSQYPHATDEQIHAEVIRQSEVARAWWGLDDALKSGNKMQQDVALNRIRAVLETRFGQFISQRGHVAQKAANGATPPPPARPSLEPQFTPGKPPNPETDGADFVRSVFGDGDPRQAFAR